MGDPIIKPVTSTSCQTDEISNYADDRSELTSVSLEDVVKVDSCCQTEMEEEIKEEEKTEEELIDCSKEMLEQDNILNYLNKKQQAVIRSIEEIDNFLAEMDQF